MADTPDVVKTSFVTSVLDYIFGYDFFVSYSHGDGKTYPRLLHEALERSGFRVFLDQTEYVPGMELVPETYRNVRKSRKFVLIARERSLNSYWVRKEVDVALTRNKIPIVINVEGALERAVEDNADLAVLAKDSHWLRIEEEDLPAPDTPSPGTVSELARSFTHMRQEAKRLRIVAGAAGMLFFLTIAVTVAAHLAYTNYQRADRSLTAVIDNSNALAFEVSRSFKNKVGVPYQVALSTLEQAKKSILVVRDQARFKPEVTISLALTLIELATAQLEINATEEARDTARQALQLLDNPSTDPPHAAVTRLNAELRIAQSHLVDGDARQAVDLLETSIAKLNELVPSKGDALHNTASPLLISLHLNAGDAYAALAKQEPKRAGDYSKLQYRNYLQALKQAETDGAQDFSELRLDAYVRLARFSPQPEVRLAFAQKARTVLDATGTQRETDLLWHQKYFDLLLLEGRSLLRQRKYGDATAAAENMVDRARSILESNPDQAVWRQLLGRAQRLLGQGLLGLGEADRAHQAFAVARDISLEAADAAHATLDATVNTAEVEGLIAEAYAAQMKFGEALEQARHAIGRFENLPGRESVRATVFSPFARILRAAVKYADKAGEPEMAVALARDYVRHSKLLPSEFADRDRRTVRALGTLCWTALLVGDDETALEAGTELSGYSTLHEADPRLSWTRLNHAHALAVSGDLDGARALYRSLFQGSNGARLIKSAQSDYRTLADRRNFKLSLSDVVK